MIEDFLNRNKLFFSDSIDLTLNLKISFLKIEEILFNKKQNKDISNCKNNIN